MELTYSSWIYTDNDEFFGGNRLEQDPLHTLEAHVTYTFQPGLWVGAGIGYDLGAESTINGIDKDDRKENLAWGLSLGYPITRQFGVKISYIGLRSQAPTGADLDTVTSGFSVMW